MFTAYVGVTVAAIVANGFIAGADFLRARFVLDNSAAVGVPAGWLTPLGLAKAAGALGLLVGLLGVPVIGTVSAAGLTVFFVGAVLAHFRAGDHSWSVAFPASYLALAVASLVLGMAVS